MSDFGDDESLLSLQQLEAGKLDLRNYLQGAQIDSSDAEALSNEMFDKASKIDLAVREVINNPKVQARFTHDGTNFTDHVTGKKYLVYDGAGMYHVLRVALDVKLKPPVKEEPKIETLRIVIKVIENRCYTNLNTIRELAGLEQAYE